MELMLELSCLTPQLGCFGIWRIVGRCFLKLLLMYVSMLCFWSSLSFLFILSRVLLSTLLNFKSGLFSLYAQIPELAGILP